MNCTLNMYTYLTINKRLKRENKSHNPEALTQLSLFLKTTSQPTYIDFNLETIIVYIIVEAG